MMKALLALTIFLSACAQPKYLTTNDPVAAREGRQEVSQCLAKFENGNCVSLAWEAMPTETATGSFLFKITRANHADGSPVLVDSTQDLAVVLWMPGMGHGSSPVKVERLDTGTYRAFKVFFTMKGQWEIRFQKKSGSVIEDQAIVPITL